MTGLLYRFLYRRLLAPFLYYGAHMAQHLPGPTFQKLKRGIEMRKNQPWLAPPSDQEPVWIHCASGEFEYARSVLRLLKQERPEIKTLVTYFSPSIAKAVTSDPHVDWAVPCPWDRPGTWRSFLKHHRPRCLLIARTDIWPEMLMQTSKAGIPSLLFSARVSPESDRFHPLVRRFYAWSMNWIERIYCVDSDDQKHLQKMGLGNKVKIVGDTRFDQVFFRLENPQPHRKALFQKARIFIAGSTWEEDEKRLIPLIESSHRQWNFVIAPHEPHEAHLQSLERQFQAMGIQSVRYSRTSAWSEGQVLLVDTVGILADLYNYAQIAFIGGSFRRKVHSVMEALASGCLTFVGPYHRNNGEAVAFQSERLESLHGQSAVTAVQSVRDWQDRLQNLNSADFPSIREEIRGKLHSRTGASRAILDWLATR